MITVENLSKHIGEQSFFDQLSFSLPNQCIAALIGPNGSGKTTLLEAITQPSKLDGGSVKMDGFSHGSLSGKRCFFYLPDRNDLFSNLTGSEYLTFITGIYRPAQHSLLYDRSALLSMLSLTSAKDALIAHYSLGMRQKILIAAAFLSGARNLILDEPFNGLDPESARLVQDMLAAHRQAGGLVVLSAHDLDLVANLSDTLLFLDRRHHLHIEKNNGTRDALDACFRTQ